MYKLEFVSGSMSNIFWLGALLRKYVLVEKKQQQNTGQTASAAIFFVQYLSLNLPVILF